MKSKKKGGAFFIAMGLLLITAALFLIGHNLYDIYRAGVSAEYALATLREDAAQTGRESDLEELPDYLLNPDMEMPETEIDGHYYIGILEIPSLELSLPIMSEWSYPNLKLAPCRYSGSAYTGNFTIAGHNYGTHFGSLKKLKSGDRISFTDVKGRSFLYEVQAVETLEPTAIDDMLRDEWDLTLFTCTFGGQARVTVRCLKTD